MQRRQVEAMAGYGIPEDDIARVLDIDPRVLREALLPTSWTPVTSSPTPRWRTTVTPWA